VNGEQGTKSVALIERCYGMAEAIEEPWCEANLDRLKSALPSSDTRMPSVEAA